MQTASWFQFGPNYAYQVARKAKTQINAIAATVGRILILIHTLFYSFHATPKASGLIYNASSRRFAFRLPIDVKIGEDRIIRSDRVGNFLTPKSL